MAANEYYRGSPDRHYGGATPTSYSRTDPPTLPPLPISQYSTLYHERHTDSPLSPVFDSTPLYDRGGLNHNDSGELLSGGRGGANRVSRQPSDEIPLRENPQPFAGDKNASEAQIPLRQSDSSEEVPGERRRRRREPEKKGFFSRRTTWVVYILSLIQASVFIAELVKNSLLTGIPIQTQPQINPMIGPSYYVLINMGGRYIPCMKDISYLNLPPDINWPCPNTTTNDVNSPTMKCSLGDLCGFPPLGNSPNQWFRFIVPIFLHGGIIHIGFNMLLQLTLGRELEKTIGSLRFLLVYLASGIFGFVLGGNFAADGIVSMGASGSLFGIIAINLLDLLYTWRERVSPWKELIFILIDIVISFVLGLLPGLDNFSHIGGFLMGLVLGVCILHSPNILRETTPEPILDNPATTKRSRRRRKPRFKQFLKDPVGFFKGRKPLWWAWWLVRAAALLAVFICFILLINNFYKNFNTCSWCKYLSCLPVNGWCDTGYLQSETQKVPGNSTSSKRDLLGFVALHDELML